MLRRPQTNAEWEKRYKRAITSCAATNAAVIILPIIFILYISGVGYNLSPTQLISVLLSGNLHNILLAFLSYGILRYQIACSKVQPYPYAKLWIVGVLYLIAAYILPESTFITRVYLCWYSGNPNMAANSS